MSTYYVIANRQFTYSDGSRKNSKEVIGEFEKRNDAEEYISDQYWVMRGMDYDTIALGKAYTKTRKFTKITLLGAYEFEEEEVVRFTISAREEV